MNEPYRLTRWAPRTDRIAGQLFTCGRPGRSMGPKKAKISDECVLAWIAGLPTSTEETTIVSLLGRKPDGLSEFSYYSFRGGFDQPPDRPDCRTFQEWLDSHHISRRYRVREYPTIDTLVPPDETKGQAVTAILSFLETGKIVVVVDSGGVGRTGNIVSAVALQLRVKLLPNSFFGKYP
jgi:hypothetical protein